MSGQLDSQIRPALLPPASCPNGCARWDNLAADGNNSSQNDANNKWKSGKVPEGAGNQCAQPDNDKRIGPWCYCKGSNDTGFCQNRDSTSSSCKTKLPEIYDKINSCTSTSEFQRNSTLAQNVFNVKNDIDSLKAISQDSLMMGDSVFSTTGNAQIALQIKARNQDLKNKKESLKNEIEHKESIVERSNRDFTDVKDSLPEKYESKSLNVLEDYTVAVLMIAYIFMIFSLIYYYIITSGNIKNGLIFGTVGGIIFSAIIFSIFYSLA